MTRAEEISIRLTELQVLRAAVDREWDALIAERQAIEDDPPLPKPSPGGISGVLFLEEPLELRRVEPVLASSKVRVSNL